MQYQNFLEYLACPKCEDTNWANQSNTLECRSCETAYPKHGRIIDFFRSSPDGPEASYEGFLGRLYGVYMDSAWLQTADSWLLGLDNRKYLDWFKQRSATIDGLFIDLPVGGAPFLSKATCYHSYPWIGVDTSHTLLRNLERKAFQAGIKDFLLVRASAYDLPIRSRSVSTVLSLFGMHCFHKKNRALRQIRRILKAGGYLHLSTLSLGHKPWSDHYIRLLEGDGTFAPSLTRSTYGDMLKQNFGFIQSTCLGSAWLCTAEN